MPLKIIFMGTPDFAVPVLEGLLVAGHEVAAVYSQPSRPAGRGQSERPSAVAKKAGELGLNVHTPDSLKNSGAQEELAKIGADLIVVVAYGLILPEAILTATDHGCINLHASLLPRWRGAAPIQRAILAGDDETGISIMQMDSGLDTGPVIAQSAIPIDAGDTAATLHDKLAALGSQSLLECLERLANGPLLASAQVGDATYAEKIEKSEAQISWDQTASEIDRKVRAFNPWPGAWFSLNGNRAKLLEGQIESGSAEPGQTNDDALSIGCGEGLYRITKLQLPGKKAQASAEFLRGFPVPAGLMMDMNE